MSNEDNNSERKVGATPEIGYRAAIASGIAVLYLLAIVLLWFAGGVLLLVFAAILLAILLDDASDQLARWLPLKRRFALPLTLLLVTAVIGSLGWLLAPRIAQQTDQLMITIPASIRSLQSYLLNYEWGRTILQNLPSASDVAANSSMLLSRVGSMFSGVFGAVANVFIVVFIAIYLAAQPRAYVNGVLKLLPQRARARGHDVIDELGETLRSWLRGKLFSMIVIGILTTVGLMLLGVPLALTIGVIAGLLDFIPYIGPVLAAIPAALIALSQDPMQAVYVVLLFIGLQSVEGYLLLPLVERRTVSILPGLQITVQVLFGLAFGLIGVALATPLTAVVTVLVSMLYVQDVLGDRVRLPGDQ